ncbi:TPA: transposase [Serratia marcescens]
MAHLYYDHNTQQHKHRNLSQEDMLCRYVGHIPSRHFKTVRRYEALEMTLREKPQKLGFAVLMKAFLNTALLCMGRLRFVCAVAGKTPPKSSLIELHRMVKKRWLYSHKKTRSSTPQTPKIKANILIHVLTIAICKPR